MGDDKITELLFELIGYQSKLYGLEKKVEKYKVLSEAYKFSIEELCKKKSKALNIFCECKDNKHEWCVDPDIVLEALVDAKEEFNASNFHNDKFDRAIKAIKILCKENKIPLRFPRDEKEED